MSESNPNKLSQEETWKKERIGGIYANKEKYVGKDLIRSGYDLPHQSYKLLDIEILNGDTLFLKCDNGASFTLPASEITSCVEDYGFSIGVSSLGILSLKA